MKTLPSSLARLAFLLSWLSVGCTPDLPEAWEVIEPHLFGMRVEVANDPTRSMPKADLEVLPTVESFVLRQYMVLPKPLEAPLERRFDMKLAVCLGFQAPDGTLVCAPGGKDLDIPITTKSDFELVTGEINLVQVLLSSELDAVAATAGLGDLSAFLSQINQVAVLGAICVEGKAERVPGTDLQEDPPNELFRCVENEGSVYKDPLAFVTTVWLDLGDDTPNHNPEFECDSSSDAGACSQGVVVEGEEPVVPGSFVMVGPESNEKPKEPRQVTAWNAAPTPEELPQVDCDQQEGLLQVRVGSGEHLIHVRVDASDRENYRYQTEEYGKEVTKSAREEILVSHAVTRYGGELAREKSVISEQVEDADAQIELAYTPPKQNPKGKGSVPPGGRLARFFFALRNQRGGFAYTTRELCLLPPEKK